MTRTTHAAAAQTAHGWEALLASSLGGGRYATQKGPFVDGHGAAELTPLERQIILDVLAGYEDREIARRASLNEEALDRHLAEVCEKLGVHSRLELALVLIDREF